MDRFEDSLRRALAERRPPAGFAERVAGRARKTGGSSRRVWRLRIAAALVSGLVIVVAGLRYDQLRNERFKNEKAKQDLLLALRITRSKLEIVESKLLEGSQH